MGSRLGASGRDPLPLQKGRASFPEDNVQRQYCVPVEAGAAAAILQPCGGKPEDKSQLDDRVKMRRTVSLMMLIC